MGQPVTVLHRALDALLVQPQGVIHDAFFRFKATDHVVGIGPSRDALRIDERSDLNLMQAGFGQGVDQLDLRSVEIGPGSIWKPSRGPSS